MPPSSFISGSLAFISGSMALISGSTAKESCPTERLAGEPEDRT